MFLLPLFADLWGYALSPVHSVRVRHVLSLRRSDWLKEAVAFALCRVTVTRGRVVAVMQFRRSGSLRHARSRYVHSINVPGFRTGPPIILPACIVFYFIFFFIYLFESRDLG